MQIADILGSPHAYQLFPSATSDSASGQAVDPIADQSVDPIAPQAATQSVNVRDQPGTCADSAETIVFIHGWMLSQAYWQPMASLLAEHYRCVTYDLRGFGASAEAAAQKGEVSFAVAESAQGIEASEEFRYIKESVEDEALKAVSPYSLAAYADDLRSLLDYLRLGQVWLVGHSLGGSIALWAAHLMPQRVKGVICLNAGGGIYIPREFEKFRAAGQQMVQFRPAWLSRLPLLPQIFARMMVHQRLARSWGQQRLQDFVRADKAAAMGALLESTTAAEVHLLPKIVGQLSQPAHFITASEDGVMPPRYVRYLASFHPCFEQQGLVFELAACGHMAMVEQPEAVVDIVCSIIAQSQEGLLAEVVCETLAEASEDQAGAMPRVAEPDLGQPV
jgi:2-succinyl-6-hydroxy-2,4-cyclohexadiene-1-carboxylate synthase